MTQIVVLRRFLRLFPLLHPLSDDERENMKAMAQARRGQTQQVDNGFKNDPNPLFFAYRIAIRTLLSLDQCILSSAMSFIQS